MERITGIAWVPLHVAGGGDVHPTDLLYALLAVVAMAGLLLAASGRRVRAGDRRPQGRGPAEVDPGARRPSPGRADREGSRDEDVAVAHRSTSITRHAGDEAGSAHGHPPTAEGPAWTP